MRLSFGMPSTKKNGKSGNSRATFSGGETSDHSSTCHSVSTETHVPALESPLPSSSSAPDPSTVLRLLLASEKSAASQSGIAGAYLHCLFFSSVPDDLRTPATIVLLGAECPSSRADRFCSFSLPLVYPPFFPWFRSDKCSDISNSCACRHLLVKLLPSILTSLGHLRATNRFRAV